MRRYGRTAFYGVLLGLATAAVAEAVRPRGGTTLLLDWEEVRRTARARLENPNLERGRLATAAMVCTWSRRTSRSGSGTPTCPTRISGAGSSSTR